MSFRFITKSIHAYLIDYPVAIVLIAAPFVLKLGCRRKIMTIKYILAVALITPFLTVSTMAQQYQGGPKSHHALRTPQINSGGDIYAQEVDVYARGVKAKKSRAYRGGPRTVVPHRK
jgi:hypothetical protein